MQKLISHFGEKTHVIWDWNGTLLADLELAVHTVNRMLSEAQLPATDVDRYKKEFGFPVIEYYRRLGFATEPKNFADLCERFTDYFRAGAVNCDLWPGTRELLREVKASGRVQSILSASEHTMLVEQVSHLGIEDLFDHVAGLGDKLASSKIERGHELMKKVGLPAAETIMVGDTNHDLEVAQALGIDAILVEHGHQCPTRLRALHHNVVSVL